MATITTTSVLLTTNGASIQNQGPDALYVSDVNPATEANGSRVESGNVIVLGAGRTYYAISHGTSDVRTLGGASGTFGPTGATGANGADGVSATVTLVAESDWPPSSDANPLHLYIKVPDP